MSAPRKQQRRKAKRGVVGGRAEEQRVRFGEEKGPSSGASPRGSAHTLEVTLVVGGLTPGCGYDPAWQKPEHPQTGASPGGPRAPTKPCCSMFPLGKHRRGHNAVKNFKMPGDLVCGPEKATS